jgi:hypothetical protein
MPRGNGRRRRARFARTILIAGLVPALVVTGAAAAGATGQDDPEAPITETPATETPAVETPTPGPAPEQTAAPEAPDPGVHEDPVPEPATAVVVAPDDVTLSIDGSLVVSYVDHPADPNGEHGEAERRVSLAVDDQLVELTGEVPLDVRTGDRIEGVVVVPDDVVAAVSDEAVEQIPSDAPVEQDSDAGAEILETASASSAPLEVADAEIETANGIVGSPAGHTVRFVTVTAGGSTHSYTPATLGAYVGAYWEDQSNGLISSFTVGGGASRSTASCPSGSSAINSLWSQALSQLGYGSSISAFVNADNGVHVVVVLPSTCLNITGLGIGSVGSSPHSNGVTMLSGSSIIRTTLIHELGHNMGLRHANVGICDADAAAVGCADPDYEYGDFYDVMGTGIMGYDVPTELNLYSQYELGFVDDADVPLISLPGGDDEESYVRALSGMSGDSSANPLGYRVEDPISGEVYFLEYRDGETGAFYSDPVRIGESGFEYDEGVVLTHVGIRFVGDDPFGGSMALAREGYGSDPDYDGFYFMASWMTDPFTSPSGGIVTTVDSCATGACDDITVTITLRTAPAAPTQPVYRFWSDVFQAHFYTMSAQERDYVIAAYDDSVWKYEKVAYRAYATQAPGTVPLYRFWSDTYRGHFYTASQSERDYIIANYPASVWKYEKIAYYVYPANNSIPNTVGVFRFWSTTKGHHFYTANPVERDAVINDYPDEIWKYEKKAFEVPKS